MGGDMKELFRRRSRAAVPLALLVAAAAAFASGQPSKESVAGDAQRLAEVGFHATGYPIVDKTVTAQAWVSKGVLNTVPYDSMTLIADLQRKSNVDLVFTEIPSDQYDEKVNLMFASRDYPDVLFTSASDVNVWNAAQGGDLWPLNDLIKRYAPNWQKAFDERPVIPKALARPDGKIYTLPYYRELLSDYGVRDILAINVDWLQKMGKTMPTTTDELYEALKAFRRGIDTGVLPKNGVPWLVVYHAWANGGEWDIYNAFGLWMKGQGTGAERYLSVDNGKVEFGATDPKLKDAVSYLHKLYAEDLITPEMFTITGSQFGAANRTVPPFVGMYGAYFLYESLDKWFDPLPPPRGPTGVRRFRSQPIRLENNRFMMFKRFPYPEAMIRWIDSFADDDFALGASYGGPTIKTNPDGTKTVVGADEEWRRHGPHNSFPGYLSYRLDKTTHFLGDQGLRDKIIREVYQPYIWPQDRHYAYVTYTDKETEDLAVLNTEIGNFVKSSIAKWIKDGNVDAQWDAYLAQLDKLGLKKAMEIFQTAYDRFHGKK
jgi:putative aldouronate transport system substrate-binding protein